MSDDNDDQRFEEPGDHEEDRDEHPQEMPAVRGKVFINADALKSMLLYAKRYANESIPEYDWKEVYGFLVGRLNKNDVHINSAVPMTSGEATEVVFGPAHYSKAAELDNEIAEKNDGSFVCGWWHSHPFKSNPDSIFLSSIDVGNQLGFQAPNPLAIAIVHDPSKIRGRDTPYGIKVFRLTRTDFTQQDLDRYALDLRVEGNTKSDPNEFVYRPVPFEIIGMTPQLFIESLSDVIDTTSKGAPPIMAYRENESRVTVGADARGPQHKLSRIQDLAQESDLITPVSASASDEVFEEMDNMLAIRDLPAIADSLPDEMEAINKVLVLPLEDFSSGSDETRIEEAEKYYIDALDFKKDGQFSLALELLKNAFRMYSKINARQEILFIQDGLMECNFWIEDFDETIRLSQIVAKLANDLNSQYFLGNASEFRGRAFLKKGNIKTASAALQDAIVAFNKGQYFAKAGQCAEMLGRILCTGDAPDFEQSIRFFGRALKYYQDAINNPKGMEPSWAKNAFITNHGSMLQKQVKALVGELKDPAKIKSAKESLAKLEPWD